jgi:hypothetical protein
MRPPDETFQSLLYNHFDGLKLGALRRAAEGRGRVEPGRVKLPETGNARRNFTI